MTKQELKNQAYDKFGECLERKEYGDAGFLLLDHPEIKDRLSKEELRGMLDYYESQMVGVFKDILKVVNSRMKKTLDELAKKGL